MVCAPLNFGYFLFFLLGGGEGVRGARKGVRGVGFLLKITGGGARREGEGGGPRGWEGVCGELEGIFFRGRNSRQGNVTKI